jgi:fibronectin-binding autotransporter adhesin
MPVTRIKNNQVTDASGANVQLGINANTKLQNYSITSTKIANNLVYGSDLTVTGNLTVQGNSTAIDTTITTIEDPIIVLASTQTSGAPAVDIGYLGFRGNESNIAFVWDESAGQFVTAFTSTGESNTTITITSYANLQIGNLSLTGNILNSSLNVTGNITGGNLLTPGLISATGTITSAANITGGNILTGGLISATSTITSAANVTGANITTAGLITATGNVTGGNILTTGLISATGNATAGNILTGGLISAAGNITSGSGSFFIGNGSQLTGVAASSANFPVSNGTSNINAAVNANITVGVSGTSNVAVFAPTGVFVTGDNSVTGNITGGNLLTGGLISATSTITSASNITGSNILTAGIVSAGGNVIADNVVTDNVISSGALTISTAANGAINLSPNGTGNVVLSNTYINGLVLNPVQDQDAATKYYVDNLVTVAISYHEAVVAATTGNLNAATGGTVTYNQPNGAANGVGATLTTTGSFTTIDTANVQTVGTRILVKDQANAVQNGVYVYSNATVITRASTEDTYGPATANALSINDYFFVTNGNVNVGSAWIVDSPAGVITFGTSNILFAQFSQSQVYSANTSAGLSLIGQTFSAKVDNNTTAFDGGGNISVKAGANLTTPNIGAATGTSLNVTANVTGGNITTAGLITATGNITGGNLITGGLVSATGTITSVANITGGNVLTGGLISATSTITSAANITGGNLLTGGLISATGAVTSGGFTTTGNVTGGNILYGSGIVSGTGNVYAANFIGNISGNIDAAGANTQVQFNDTGDILGASAGFTFDKVGNILTANGNITGANLFTGGSVSATGNLTGANLVLTTGTIDGPAAGRITINGSDIDTDFAVDGDTLANVFYVDAGTGTASFGASTQITNAIVNFATTTSIKAPVGNTAQRPGTGVTGMLRFNTTSNALEVYDNSAWSSVGVPVFTVIADQQFAGDGSTLAFTLGSTQTTNSCIVSINGVVQIPTLAYAVAGTDPTCVLTFTEAPAAGDVIDVRQITTTTSVTSIANSSGNAVIAVSATSAQTNVTGDLSVSGSILGGNINSTAITNGNSNVSVVSSGGNVTVSVAGYSNVAVFGSTGLGLGTGNLSVGNIFNNNANGVGNIGSTGTRFNQVFALASSAQYADLAEKYTADATYETGTVVAFGGTQEVTISATDRDCRVAGVISALPSFRMNDALESEYTAMVALTGRVPTKVTGTVRKGDMMVSAGNGVARAEANPQIGTVIGKALEDFDGTEGTIEVVVGRV